MRGIIFIICVLSFQTLLANTAITYEKQRNRLYIKWVLSGYLNHTEFEDEFGKIEIEELLQELEYPEQYLTSLNSALDSSKLVDFLLMRCSSPKDINFLKVPSGDSYICAGNLELDCSIKNPLFSKVVIKTNFACPAESCGSLRSCLKPNKVSNHSQHSSFRGTGRNVPIKNYL